MCRECNWSEAHKEGIPLKKCDCGHSQWQEAFSQEDHPFEKLYRCMKCDSLFVLIRSKDQ